MLNQEQTTDSLGLKNKYFKFILSFWNLVREIGLRTGKGKWQSQDKKVLPFHELRGICNTSQMHSFLYIIFKPKIFLKWVKQPKSPGGTPKEA